MSSFPWRIPNLTQGRCLCSPQQGATFSPPNVLSYLSPHLPETPFSTKAQLPSFPLCSHRTPSLPQQKPWSIPRASRDAGHAGTAGTGTWEHP